LSPTKPKTRRHATGTVRIIGGRWKRTALPVGDVPGLRPTPDRVRETLFNWLTHAFGDLAGRSALDLYAGSGALGFEAASRGATDVVLVETHPAALAALRSVREKLGADRMDIRAGDALPIGKGLLAHGRRYDIVFVDPPFGQDRLQAALPLAVALASASGLIYVEAEFALAESAAAAVGCETYRADRAGDVFYHLLQRKRTQVEETGC
jgi:16S rRNA (guanine966-N2)-methyltransferase